MWGMECNFKRGDGEWVSSLPELKLTDEQMAGEWTIRFTVEEKSYKGYCIAQNSKEDGNNFEIGDYVWVAFNRRMEENQTISDAVSKEIIVGISVKITCREVFNYESDEYEIEKDTEVNYIFKETDYYGAESEYEQDEDYVFATEEEALTSLRNDDDFRSMNSHFHRIDTEIKKKNIEKIDGNIENTKNYLKALEKKKSELELDKEL